VIHRHRLFRVFLISVSALLLCSANIGALAHSDASYFTDINGWYRPAIEYNVSLGIFHGISEDTFLPDQPMTQAMLVTVLGRIAENYGKIIEDVQRSDRWYAKYATWATIEEIIPYQELPFSQNGVITREVFAAYLCNFMDYLEIKLVEFRENGGLYHYTWNDPSYSVPLMDFPPKEEIPTLWTETAIFSVMLNNVMLGYADNTFRPHKPITRAEACQVFLRTGQNFLFVT